MLDNFEIKKDQGLRSLNRWLMHATSAKRTCLIPNSSLTSGEVYDWFHRGLDLGQNRPLPLPLCTQVYTKFKCIYMCNGSARLHGELFPPISFPATRSLSLPKPSFLLLFLCFVILPVVPGVKGWGHGKTFNSVSLSWKNPLIDPHILVHNDKWVSNFPPDLGATKHISTFTCKQGNLQCTLTLPVSAQTHTTCF